MRFAIPTWVNDLASFRRWTASADFPERGAFAYLNAEIWVDLSREELLSHNQVKVAFTHIGMSIVDQRQLGRWVPAYMRLTNVEANLSTEPDGLFYLYASIRSGRLRLVDKPDLGIMELEGSPDMVMEVVSKTSVHKDTVVLKELYWKAKIPEYWLVDVRPGQFRFDILLAKETGYEAQPVQDGWVFSPLFGLHFTLKEERDPLGERLFRVLTRA
ncbi:MAG: Uma2 family endonuclease [Gemmataceae bacterium]